MESNEASSPERPSLVEEDEAEGEEGRGKGVSEYEKQRLARIRENRARLEALGLPHLASSLLGPLAKHQTPNQAAAKNKKNKSRNSKNKEDESVGVDDDEYRPSDEDGEGELSASSSNEEEEEEEEVYSPPSGSRHKGKRKSSNAAKVRKTSSVRGSTKEFDVADDDVALKQAILLSLGSATEDTGAVLGRLPQNSGSNATYTDSCGRKDRSNIKETAAKRNSRKGNKSRVQLTEDEVVAYFFSFDESGKGSITFRDLQRMVTAHDFTWTDIEIANMIHSFDSDRDDKLSLGDFRTIVTRCNMLREPEEC